MKSTTRYAKSSWAEVIFSLAGGLILTFIATGSDVAAVTPAALFTDNAVLQADREVPVWGWDNPGQNVTVSIGQASASGNADKDGRWEVRLPAMKPSDQSQELKIAGSSTVTATNVLI